LLDEVLKKLQGELMPKDRMLSDTKMDGAEAVKTLAGCEKNLVGWISKNLDPEVIAMVRKMAFRVECLG